MTQRQLGEKVGVSQQAIYMLESGCRVPSGRLAKALDSLTDGFVPRYEMRPDIFGPMRDSAAA